MKGSQDKARQAVAIAVGIFALFTAALELYRSWWLWNADPWKAEQPSTWRITSAQVAALDQLLEPIRQATEAERRLAVLPNDLEGEGAFLALWARYLLPEFDILPAEQLPYRQDAAFLLTTPDTVQPCKGFTAIHSSTAHFHTVGRLYRVERQAADP